jgi:hypothetical protein
MATVFYKDTAAINKFTEILLPGNRSLTIPIGELTTIPDELAELIPENIPHLTVIMGNGSPKGQTAEAVVKQLVNYTGQEEVEAAQKAEAEDGVAKAKASARARAVKTTDPESSNTGF